MYLPKHFEETRPERLHGFISAHPLGLLITHGIQGLVANPIPFLLQAQRGAKGTLIGHVARANPVWRDLAASTSAAASAAGAAGALGPTQALVVFQGAQGYISPGWYPAKQEHGKVVPTWNYSTVQARGPLQVHDSPDAVRAVVHALTSHFEAGQRAPWAMVDAPADYIETMLRAIVMIEVPIVELVGKFKLSQNRSTADRLGTEAGLQERGESALAADMQSLREAP